MVGTFSRFRRQGNDAREDHLQFAPDGRDLSDTTHPDYDPATDPELRLRVVRTAAESIAESGREEVRRRDKRLSTLHQTSKSTGGSLKPKRSLFGRRRTSDARERPPATAAPPLTDEDRLKLERIRTQALAAAEAEESAQRQERQDGKKSRWGRKGHSTVQDHDGRRTVYVNVTHGSFAPRMYSRNKVRTSKYSLATFLPKNLTEQFRRVANLYFLLLIILQVFPIFGAAAPQVAMLPLLAILLLTGVKDAIEDFRRHKLDNAVNCSAVTVLGDWTNCNLPAPRKGWWPMRSSAKPSGVTRGVRKLREKEGVFDTGFLYEDKVDATSDTHGNASSYTVDIDSYPPTLSRMRSDTTASSALSLAGRERNATAPSDTVDYSRSTHGTAKWERTLWKKLEVGDIVLLKEDEQIPADLVILSTSDPDGLCFVETKNLDGETNLKQKKCLRATATISNEEDLEHAQFWLESEAPHANLYAYQGVLKWNTKGDAPGREHPITEGRRLEDSTEKQEAITINEILLRGCALRNTRFVIGLVLFTGADSKIMLNQGETPSKRSRLEIESNFSILVNFGILMVLCVACAVASSVYERSGNRSANLYEPNVQVSSAAIVNALVTFGAWQIGRAHV